MRHERLFATSFAIVLHNLGLLLQYIALVPLGLLPVAAYYREWGFVPEVLAMAGAFVLAGLALARVPTRRDPRLREGLLIAALGWLVVPLGSVILLTSGEGWIFLDAYVETMSAWSGTGVTVADVTRLSQTTLAWRTLMQWVGGLGVIVLTLAILARPGTGAFTLYASEAREDKLRPSVLSTVRTLWRIYVGLTIGAILLLLAVGLPPWDAVHHAMTGIGTAGMSPLPAGIGAYDDWRVEAALVVIMVLGALPFIATYALLRGRWRGFLEDEQVRAMAVVLVLALPILVWVLGRFLGDWAPETIRQAVFQGVSAVTTTGFQTADVRLWDERTKLFIVGLMLLGGAAGSTAGGIKLVRGVLLLKGALWKLRRSGVPHFAVTTFPFGGERLSDQEANEEFAEAAFILILWAVLLFGAILAFLSLLPARYPLVDVIFEISSLQANNGMSVGIVSAALPPAAKVGSILLMWAGRLEILPVLLLLRGLLPRLGKR